MGDEDRLGLQRLYSIIDLIPEADERPSKSRSGSQHLTKEDTYGRWRRYYCR